jgi:DNA ligase (NAD+)
VSGITITRATLHNEDEIRRLGLKIGDTVVVGRAGDVIPNIIKVLPELRNGSERDFSMPSKCPACKTNLEKSESEAVWRCPNPKCFARSRRSFYHFVSRGAFDMDGLGPKIIDRLLDEGLVQDPADIFSLKEGDVAQLERFGEKSAENLIASIQEKKEITLPRFIYALGIRNVGEQTAADLAQTFGSLKNLRAASLADFESVENIGPVVAQSLHRWFSDKHTTAFLDKLIKSGVKISPAKQAAAGKLAGKVFVLTGSLESLEREAAKEKIRALGGQVSESVSKKVNFVVVGKDPGSKAARAKQLGVPVIQEEEFLKMIQ